MSRWGSTQNVLVTNAIIRESEDDVLHDIIQAGTQPTTGNDCCGYIWRVEVDGVTWPGSHSPVWEVPVIACTNMLVLIASLAHYAAVTSANREALKLIAVVKIIPALSLSWNPAEFADSNFKVRNATKSLSAMNLQIGDFLHEICDAKMSQNALRRYC
jgi:hypothetical protein